MANLFQFILITTLSFGLNGSSPALLHVFQAISYLLAAIILLDEGAKLFNFSFKRKIAFHQTLSKSLSSIALIRVQLPWACITSSAHSISYIISPLPGMTKPILKINLDLRI